MNMIEDQTLGRSGIPSCFATTLCSLVGHRIVGATRYSWWTPEETEQECGVGGRDIFSLTSGPVTITFDTGVVLGIASDPSTNSVSVWIEKNEAGQLLREEPLESDDELHPVSASDQRFADDFWRLVIGSKVGSISVLVRNPTTARLAELPNEVGLCFSLDSGVKLVASHGLHDGSDDFSIISDQRIQASLRAELQELSLGV